MTACRKPRWGKLLLRGLLVITLLLAVLGAVNYKLIARIYHGITLFEPEKLAGNFRSADQRFPSRVVEAGDQVSLFAYNLQQLPGYYTYGDEVKGINQFLLDTDTTGFLVTNGDEILYEEYFLGNTEESRAIVWSLSKSVVSVLVGIAIDEGYIQSVSDPVTKYVPSLVASGYDGVSIEDVLQMSSGIRFNEDYFDATSDFNKMAPRSIGLGGPLEDVLATLDREHEPGTVMEYASSDSQVLGMVVRAATGVDLSSYTETRLWKPAGMEARAYWLLDSSGVESAFGGFNATLRDLARFGSVYLNEGFWNGRQIVSSEWVRASALAAKPHLMPGDGTLGYGYQWWVPGGDEGDFLAMGIYGQAIYVNPNRRIVIAKTSAYRSYEHEGEEMELESVAFFRAIAKALGQAS
jgi:CubicO group peptidase (beta-lactamase class C family)